MSHRWFLAVILVGGCAPAPPPGPIMDPGRLRPDLEIQFARAAAAWNRGDLDEFMSLYAPGDLPTFVSEGRLIRGFDAIRAVYAPSFAPGNARDSLRLENFEVRGLGEQYALVWARYVLFRNGTTNQSGPFTLLLERRPEGWKILHDHSSSD